MEGQTILITGVAGFIASHVVVHLVQTYPKTRFVGLDKMSYCSNQRNFEEITNCPNFQFIKADLTNLEFIDHIFHKEAISMVMHFAAYTHVDHSFGNSLTFTQNNVVGTHVLLEVAKKYYVTRFIHVSTDEVYGSQEDSSSESSCLDPTNPYAATKAAAEHLVKSYYHSFKLPIIITRGNNCYGPKQYPEKVIPKFVLRLWRNLPCIIHGSGTQLRSFLYIQDVVRAFDLILQQGQIGEIYNIGCQDEHSIVSLAQRLVQKLKPGQPIDQWLQYGQDRAFNDKRYNISNDKLCALGWSPQVDIDTGIDLTMDWYKQHNSNYWFTSLTTLDNEAELLTILNK